MKGFKIKKAAKVLLARFLHYQIYMITEHIAILN